MADSAKVNNTDIITITKLLDNTKLTNMTKVVNNTKEVDTPSLNEKIDSGKSHLQDLARRWRTSKGVDIPKISQFYWALFEKTRFYIIKLSKKRAKIEPKYS